VNPVQKILHEITEDQLRQAVKEMYDLDHTGILPAGIVREIANQLTKTGVTHNDALSIAQAHVMRAAAFAWVGLS